MVLIVAPVFFACILEEAGYSVHTQCSELAVGLSLEEEEEGRERGVGFTWGSVCSRRRQACVLVYTLASGLEIFLQMEAVG